METYGQKIQRLRRERNWTQEELADRSGVPKRTIQEIEGDRVRNPQRRNVLMLNQTLEVEGDVEEERDSWSPDVKMIVDIVGAYLSNISRAEQIAFLRDITERALPPE